MATKSRKYLIDQDFNGNRALKLRLEESSSEPTGAQSAQMFYKPGTGAMISDGSTSKPIGGAIAEYPNEAITPVDGVAKMEIDNPAGTTKVLVSVMEIATGDEVEMAVNITTSKIKVEWNESAASVTANTYKVVVSY